MKKRRTQEHLTQEECEDLKKACQTFSDQLIVYGLLYTGMRVDELCHIVVVLYTSTSGCVKSNICTGSKLYKTFKSENKKSNSQNLSFHTV